MSLALLMVQIGNNWKGFANRRYWQTAGEREGENPMMTPLPYIIIFGMATPFVILAIAFANGWVKVPVRWFDWDCWCKQQCYMSWMLNLFRNQQFSKHMFFNNCLNMYWVFLDETWQVNYYSYLPVITISY